MLELLLNLYTLLTNATVYRPTLKVIISAFSLYINVYSRANQATPCCLRYPYFPYSKEPQSLSLVSRRRRRRQPVVEVMVQTDKFVRRRLRQTNDLTA